MPHLRSETPLRADVDPNAGSLVKRYINERLLVPTLARAVVMANTTRFTNEEWITAVAFTPLLKTFREHVPRLVAGEINVAVYLSKTQTADVEYVSLFDFEYLVIDKRGKVSRVKKAPELKETLIHTFLPFNKGKKTLVRIELVAFDAFAQITPELIKEMSFLDAEVFNREHANIKSTYEERRIYLYKAICCGGRFALFTESYSWFDSRKCLVECLRHVRRKLLDDISSLEIAAVSEFDFDLNVSQYNEKTGSVLVKDFVILFLLNFCGYDVRLNTYHRVDLKKIDTTKFVKEIEATFDAIEGK
ncbi:RNA polymerase subunit RPO35 [Nile crocodilepox virus]|uniref:DNA-directed RNA polymerase 35 kDa subunit n=1 Tax=Nile crocodilepox virus (isolate Crocodylus niloticus/Zimbabwe/Ume/2001) TaxID=1289473 RepID=Q070A1_CPRVZ|nr:RNA polymerase subunit RPO35 [Nile crocodilepox virus]ABJ09041.1 RNA polymerase subunit RPO35 [Nile crocodilepox virus]